MERHFIFMTNNNHKSELEVFYTRLIKNMALETFNKVCTETGLPRNPKSGAEIRPVPVYEDNEFNLLTCVNERTTTTIQWPASLKDIYVPAYFKRYRDPVTKKPRNEVVVIADNYCYARFFAAKELMHCLIDDEKYPATNSIALVKELIDELSISNSRISCAPQTMVDEVAWMGALLYTIPDSWIPLLRKMVEDIATQADADLNQSAYLHVAKIIRVPELFLRKRLKLEL